MIFPWSKRKRDRAASPCLSVTFDQGGIVFTGIGSFSGLTAVEWLARGHRIPGRHGDAVLYLAQLEQDGVIPTFDAECIFPWETFYSLRSDEAHADSIALFDLPPTCTLTPSLTSSGALSDPGFAIGLSWLRGNGAQANTERAGGAIRCDGAWSLLPDPAWRLVEAVAAFSHLPQDQRNRLAVEREWGRIRRIARDAGAQCDSFLARTIVLTPDKLDLALNNQWIGDTQVIEVIPGLAEVPAEKWLHAFDSHQRVQDHYLLTGEDGGVTRIIPSPAVAQVLAEIKRMPGRRIGGKRAQAFLRNPYAVLGPDIAEAIPPERFEQARRDAGLRFYAFTAEAERDESGRIQLVRLVILPDAEDEEVSLAPELRDKLTLKTFRNALAKALGEEAPCLAWAGRDFELRGDAAEQLRALTLYLGENWAEEQPQLSFEDVFDLSRYSDRITAIDVAPRDHAPYIPVESGAASWMPEGMTPIISWQPPGAAEPVRIATTEDDFRQLVSQTERAAAAGSPMVDMPGWPAPLTLDNARALIDAMEPAFAAPQPAPASGIEPEDKPHPEKAPPPEKLTLVIKSNLETTDYEERRAEWLRFDPATPPHLPAALRDDIMLKPHQHEGVAWLQHLWKHMPQVRGCIFADDMGLGKTLQMLAFIAWYLETAPQPLPVLVVAPVSLLENWHNEVAKFFKPGLRLRVMYGKELAQARLPVTMLDQQLVDKGLTKFLRPDWLGDGQIVLTTYETLRDLEFSFSALKWGIMVCDEAQKIKTPTSMMTRAAKKQNVEFKIACTGTPVENRLADLWCLFDFVQPGLLGPLSAFCRTYSRPIEAETEEQRAAVEQLRRLIEPQIMRRMKQDVADLPPKLFDETCRHLRLSHRQTALYAAAMRRYQERKAELESGGGDSGKGAMVLLGMLHALRSICAHPMERNSEDGAQTLPPLTEFIGHSPKMRWLIEILHTIRKRDEKVIVFTEFRDIQRALQRYVAEAFGLTVTVVNGDTAAQNSGNGQSRQARIDAFQTAPGFNVIILSTTAVGFGVNVQAANHVIHFTRPWNPAKEDQATDRAYRIGQTKPVTVYCPTVVAPDFTTFEAKLGLLLGGKRRLADDMLNGAEDIRESDWQDL